MIIQTDANGFEVETCGRCGGSGHYSRCERYGTTCFDCAGRKVRHSKRGKTAHAFYKASLTKPASEVKVGDFARFHGTKWVKIAEVNITKNAVRSNGISYDYLTFRTKAGNRFSESPSSPVESIQTNEELQALKAAAVAYQATLTASGKPAKVVA